MCIITEECKDCPEQCGPYLWLVWTGEIEEDI